MSDHLDHETLLEMAADQRYDIMPAVRKMLHAAGIALREERQQLAELTILVGTETPIAALSLADTWKTEKTAYMEYVGELEQRLADTKGTKKPE